jgi:hypothetical protein
VYTLCARGCIRASVGGRALEKKSLESLERKAEDRELMRRERKGVVVMVVVRV